MEQLAQERASLQRSTGAGRRAAQLEYQQGQQRLALQEEELQQSAEARGAGRRVGRRTLATLSL